MLNIPSTNYDIRDTKLIAIIGPTASGKTALALQLAQRFNDEIICADSRTVFKRLDIGTAKPTTEERALVPHHLLDLVEPGEPFTAAQFKELAEEAIDGIQSRNKVPVMVGGTGLFIDSVLYDYQFPTPADAGARSKLDSLETAELQRRVDEGGVELNPSDYANRRRLIRALETAGQPRGRSARLRPQTLVIGLAVNKQALQSRIAIRVEKMLEQGFLDEVNTFIKEFGRDKTAGFGIGYKAFVGAVEGQKSVAAATAEFVRGDLNLAKRQMTWFKRNRDIHWVASPDEAALLVERFLDSREQKLPI